MRKLITSVAALGLLCAIGAGTAHGAAAMPTGPAASLAKVDCAREKARMGKRAFLKRYGPKRAPVKCVIATLPEARAAIAVATAACQEELDSWGLEDFLVDWESFAECVATYSDWEMDGGLEDADEVGDAE